MCYGQPRDLLAATTGVAVSLVNGLESSKRCPWVDLRGLAASWVYDLRKHTAPIWMLLVMLGLASALWVWLEEREVGWAAAEVIAEGGLEEERYLALGYFVRRGWKVLVQAGGWPDWF